MKLPAAGQSMTFQWRIWVCLGLILMANFGIRWHLRDVPLERDEGEYAYAGQLLLEGVPPYQLAWNMKFPGTYYAYAGLMAVFGQTAEGIRMGIILVTSLSIILVFLLGLELASAGAGWIAALLFMLMTAVPSTAGLAGHATHFVVLLVCAGTYALLRAERKWPQLWTFGAGTALGAAILMKQHAAVFSLAAFGWLVIKAIRSRGKAALQAGTFAGGVALPLAIIAGVLAISGVWGKFYHWTIEYARAYVSITPLSLAPHAFLDGFGPIFSGGMWVWIFGAGAMLLLFVNTSRKRLVAVGAGLLAAGLVAVCPGLYFRNHYFLMVIPGVALLNSAVILELQDRAGRSMKFRGVQWPAALLVLVLAGELAIRNSPEWFLMSPTAFIRKLYGISPFPESPVVARYIATNTVPTDTIAVLGSEPQIYFLAHRHSATGYLYMYPLTEPQPLAAVMRGDFVREFEEAKPRYVIFNNCFSSWSSWQIPGYTDKTMNSFVDWWDDYKQKQNYELVGLVDIGEDQPAKFYWDSQVADRTNTAAANISIFRRR